MEVEDKRQRLLFLTSKGSALETRLTDIQCTRFANAYLQSGASDVAGFEQVLNALLDKQKKPIMKKVQIEMGKLLEPAAHVLVVDDDQRLLELLKRFLEESGFWVTGASNTNQADSYMNSIHFDLLVIDIMMPGKTGIEWLVELRKKTSVPAIFLTALGETEDRIEGLSAGADDYLSKPFEPRELVLRIKEFLNGP